MVVTLFGIVMDVSPLQPWKAYAPMVVTLLGMVVFLHPVIRVLFSVLMMALQLSRESKISLPASTVMLSNALQPAKTLYPILVTLLGIVIDVNPVQQQNAH